MDKVLELQSQAMTLEAFSLQASKKAITELLPNFVTGVSALLDAQKKQNEFTITLVRSDNDLEAKLKRNDYASLRKLTISGPRGIRSYYLTYINAVNQSVLHSEKLLSDTLLPFSRWVNTILASPEQLSSVVGSYKAPKDLAKGLEVCKSEPAGSGSGNRDI